MRSTPDKKWLRMETNDIATTRILEPRRRAAKLSKSTLASSNPSSAVVPMPIAFIITVLPFAI